MRFKGYFLGLLSSVSYGLIPLFVLPIKKAGFGIDTTLFYRFAFAALLLGSYLLLKQKSFNIERNQILTLAVLGMFYGISSDSLFLAYDYLNAGVASTLLFIYPLLVAIIMALVFKEKLNSTSIFAIVFTLIGVLLLSLQNGKFAINGIGLFIIFISALGYALYIVTVSKSNVKNLNGLVLTFYSFLFTSVYYAVKLLTDSNKNFEIPTFSLGLNLALFALVTTVISSLALVFAIKYIGSTATSILGAFEPVVAVSISVLLFDEFFSLNLALGISCIILGVTLNIIGDAYKNRKKLKKATLG
ncbi:DMT family transporter [Flavobacterium agricola]|uniref:DMT family transporter n=1 Tax=Flavobacterium agricola TaxID=2870839 RepID=A0ABY6LZI2_9FLAO|nr:DMT family transporter [Flavobacterium agricola]UYW01729.1 DMT family transporter [Flavobacterium agricola]